MFSVFVRGRQRRLWSPGTIVVSVLAHVLLLAGAVSAGVGQHENGERLSGVYDLPPMPQAKAPPPPPRETTPPPPAPEPQKVVLGDHRVVEHVEKVPDALPEIDPDEQFDASEYERDGRQAGNVIVDNPPPSTGQPTGNPQPAGEGDGPVDVGVVEELPTLANRAEAERLFRRYYPPLLRESGMTGRTVVLMIIDAEGRVEPGSVSVQETSHPAFAEPAIKVAEKMRFRPARLNQRPVSVIIAIPIEWRLEN